MSEGFGFVRGVGLLVTLAIAALAAVLGIQYLLGGGPDQFLMVAGLAVLAVAIIGFGVANHLTDD